MPSDMELNRLYLCQRPPHLYSCIVGQVLGELLLDEEDWGGAADTFRKVPEHLQSLEVSEKCKMRCNIPHSIRDYIISN